MFLAILYGSEGGVPEVVKSHENSINNAISVKILVTVRESGPIFAFLPVYT